MYSFVTNAILIVLHNSISGCLDPNSCQYILLFILHFFCIVQYSVFGSIVTIGGVISGLLNGRIADHIGRRGVSFFFHIYIS